MLLQTLHLSTSLAWNPLVALLADTHFATPFALKANTRALIAVRANEHHVRSMNWSLKLNNPRLDFTPSSTHRPLVLLDNVDSGNDHALLFGQNTLHRASKPSIIPGNNLYCIAFLDSVHCNTSQPAVVPRLPQERARQSS
jgi:hypothetical protein